MENELSTLQVHKDYVRKVNEIATKKWLKNKCRGKRPKQIEVIEEVIDEALERME